MDKVLAFGAFFLAAICVIFAGMIGYPFWGYAAACVIALVVRVVGVRLWAEDEAMIRIWFQYRYYCNDPDRDGIMPGAVYPGAKLPRKLQRPG